jgi:16S rRNA (guanine966-N2)-methyltransferase
VWSFTQESAVEGVVFSSPLAGGPNRRVVEATSTGDGWCRPFNLRLVDMRIVSGRWAGRDLTSPGGRVRPTAEALRRAWFERLDGSLEGSRVLDLFAGSGALGLEALSRGAASCDFVENGRGALHALKANVARFRAKSKTRLFRSDAFRFVEGIRDPYDLCVADPPYDSSLAERLATIWFETRFAAVLSIEHDRTTTLPRGPRGVRSSRVEWDRSAVTIFRAR